jgi:hypothetical protein
VQSSDVPCKQAGYSWHGLDPALLLQLHAQPRYCSYMPICVRQLRARGFLLTTLLRVVRRFLQRHWFLYADSRSDALYKAIKTACLVTVQ